MADHTTSHTLIAVRRPRMTSIQIRRARTALSDVARLKDDRLKDQQLRMPGQLRSFHDCLRAGRSCGKADVEGCGAIVWRSRRQKRWSVKSGVAFTTERKLFYLQLRQCTRQRCTTEVTCHRRALHPRALATGTGQRTLAGRKALPRKRPHLNLARAVKDPCCSTPCAIAWHGPHWLFPPISIPPTQRKHVQS